MGVQGFKGRAFVRVLSFVLRTVSEYIVREKISKICKNDVGAGRFSGIFWENGVDRPSY